MSVYYEHPFKTVISSVLFSWGLEIYSLTHFYRIWFNSLIVVEWVSERETCPDEHEKQLEIKGNHG